MKPSIETVKQLGQGFDIVPVYVELLSDIRTPISVLKALKKGERSYILIGKCR